MPLNTTEAERRATGARDLALKMQLEGRYKRELRELFAVINRDLEASVLTTGQAQEAANYEADFLGVVSRHYRRVNERFSNRIFDFLDKEIDNEEEPVIAVLILIAGVAGITVTQFIAQMKAQARLESNLFIQSNAEADAVFITRTNQKQLDSAVAVSRASLENQLDRTPTNQEVSSLAGRTSRAKTAGRVNNIAATGTQKIAEGTKQIERQVFISNRNGLSAMVANIKPLRLQEFWVTLGDQIVRPSHVAADGSKKNESGVFTVQGQSLQFPGDTSLGATPDNTQGCRCAAVVSIDDEFPEFPGPQFEGFV